MPRSARVFMTFCIAAVFCARAWAAVCACVTTPATTSAVSGRPDTVAEPTTEIEGTDGSWATAGPAAVSAIAAASHAHHVVARALLALREETGAPGGILVAPAARIRGPAAMIARIWGRARDADDDGPRSGWPAARWLTIPSLDPAEARMVEERQADAPGRHAPPDLLEELGEHAHLVLRRAAAEPGL